jgi:hypothetical protein
MRRTALVIAVSSIGLSACITDPEVWEGIAMGLNEVAAEMEWENQNCYWSTPPGNPYGATQKYCPGDWGYQPPVVVYCAPRDRDCDGVRDRRERRRDRDRDRDD